MYKASFKEVKELNTIPQSGEFEYRIKFENKIDPALLFLRTFDQSWFKLSKADGITMNLSPETCMGTGNPAFIGKRQQHLLCKASTELNFTARAKNEKAGLLIYQSEFNFYYLCKSIQGGRQVLQIFKGNKQNNNMSLIKQVYVGKSKIYLQIEADKSVCNFYYSNNAKDWKLLAGGLDGTYLSTKVAGGFVGSLFALYATSSGLPSDNKASFKWLDYAGKY